MTNNKSHYIQSDFILLLLLFIGVSLLAIYNAEQLPQNVGQNYVIKQIVWFSAGIFLVSIIQFFDLEQLYKASIYIYGFGVLVLIVLLISPESIAAEIRGTKSWFTLPGLSIQPAEFTKITTILFLAAAISQHKGKYEVPTIPSDIFLLLKIGVITAIPIVFILMQPDFGTSMVYVFIAGMMVLLSGIDWKIIGGLVLTVAALAVSTLLFIVNFPELAEDTIGIAPYQINRLMTWFDPSQNASGDTYQFDLSMLALGSGQLTGKGLNNLQVVQLPDAHTDFIFSIIGESFGFIGSALVILLYFIMLYRLVTLGLKSFENSQFGSYISFGFLSLLLIHAFQNIGMTIGIMPITGIPLLLISYGGSSVLSTMIGFGLVYRVAVEIDIQNDYLFK
ncbi:FtsW/RodA/SpoVE family cell cycle protein [Ornithinibacillus halophilus]|uniref:Cell elongation-specific peptidoglycan biosynthesis regulator RodA n=1 Tax=Ornithinibacillus halophilus TaxID=930117 RepID=A0A1M5HG62_9BACI|nr:FtsW/RodA/SpoVE family cell cycle protein [Ornithinibacillus halophilus]SHG14954.1 cell elongation-specific peptidoglycan biosynthesis regulator RodA [Ornithinibacillus halophilus]